MAKSFNLFGDIVANDAERWFESDVTPGIFVGWLSKQEGDIEININSNGGSVTAGLAIANAIKAYDKGSTTCNVLGIAASMASVIACAGDKLTMGEGAFLMVHNPWTATVGNADDLRKDANTLDKMRDSIIGFYQSKAYNKSADDLKALMDAETWLNPSDAIAAGFLIDSYTGELKAAASLTRRALDRAPDAARALVEFHAERPGSVPAENWEARFKGLSQKYNEAQAQALKTAAALEADYKAKLDAVTAERDTFKSQLDQARKDLDGQKAALSTANKEIEQLRGKAEEDAKALQAATADLATTRDSLAKAEEQVKHLEETRDALTAGVLTPPPAEASYAARMSAAKTPEEREALRAQKARGKIK